MKTKTMKKVIAASVAAMMMCAPMMNVWADPASTPSYSITIDNTTLDIADASHTYTAYQIFSGDYDSDSKKLSNIVWGSGVSDTKQIENKTILQAINNLTGFSDCKSAADVAAVLSTLNDDASKAKVEEFAETVAPYVTGGSTLAATGAGTKKYTVDLGNNPGYYMVMDTSNPVKSSKTKYLLKVVEANTEIIPKMEVPTITKYIVDGNNKLKADTASLKEEVEYKLESKVPDMTDYNQYFFVVNDKLSPGLELKEDSFKVWVGGTDAGNLINQNTGNGKYSATSGYYVEVYKDENNTYNNAFRLVFNNLKGTTAVAGTPIMITYSAYLGGANGEYADEITYGTTIDDSNENKVNLIYSNDPNWEYTGTPEQGQDTVDDPSDDVPAKPYEPPMVDNPNDPNNPDNGTPANPTPNDPTDDVPKSDEPSSKTPDDKVYTYTAKLDVHKTDGSDQALAGAVFELYDSNDTLIDTVTSAATTGLVEFKGLGAGTYILKEKQAPAGYNKDTTEYTLVISAVPNDENNTKCTWSIGTGSTKDSSNNDVFTVTASTYNVTIKNQSGATLPSTGGIGTTIFYVSGGTLILGAVVVMITKKRMSLKEDK